MLPRLCAGKMDINLGELIDIAQSQWLDCAIPGSEVVWFAEALGG